MPRLNWIGNVSLSYPGFVLPLAFSTTCQVVAMSPCHREPQGCDSNLLFFPLELENGRSQFTDASSIPGHLHTPSFPHSTVKKKK